MAYYIKVTKAVADSLGLTAIRNKTADGNVILWQSDLAKFGERGDNIFVRAKIVGGIALTAVDAKKEIDGTDTPVVPVTPVEFGGTGLTKAEEEALNPSVPSENEDAADGTEESTETVEDVTDTDVPTEEPATGDDENVEEMEEGSV